MRTRVGRVWVAWGAALLVWACTGPGPVPIACETQLDGCECFAQGVVNQSAQTSVCNPAAFPGTTCCADDGWPDTGGAGCQCLTGEVYCGLVGNYFADGSAGCVCSLYPASSAQTPGTTCYPGASTTGPTLGVCCNFQAAPSDGGITSNDCACGSGLHTCAAGAPEVATCSAASFPPRSGVCRGGQHQVTSCLGNAGDAGPVTRPDGSPPDGASAEAGVCGSGPPGMCNTLANTGTVVTPTCVAGSAAAMSGGAIADGTYVLASATAYTSSCSGVSLPTGGPTTMLVSGGCIQTIDVTGGAHTYTWTTAGTTLTMTEICPASSTVNLPYTATATTLAELGPLSAGIQVVSVFQKQ
jgi:hypothetical protein